LRNIYQPPAGSSGNIVGHATAWAKEEEEKTSLSSPSFFFLLRKEEKKTSKCYCSSENCCIASPSSLLLLSSPHDSSFPNHFLNTSYDLKIPLVFFFLFFSLF
jgi:hypothetical protein